MSGSPPVVRIRYRRPPDREKVFRQLLVHDAPEVKVTLARDVVLDEPVVVGGRTVLESGSDAVWFTFPGTWHDIGRFHAPDGAFTGIYANVLTPPEIGSDHRWDTTDLYLDVWLAPRALELRVLDREQLREAEQRGWVDGETAERARREVDEIQRAYDAGRWPPPVVEEWTLERALEAAGEG